MQGKRGLTTVARSPEMERMVALWHERGPRRCSGAAPGNRRSRRVAAGHGEGEGGVGVGDCVLVRRGCVAGADGTVVLRSRTDSLIPWSWGQTKMSRDARQQGEQNGQGYKGAGCFTSLGMGRTATGGGDLGLRTCACSQCLPRRG